VEIFNIFPLFEKLIVFYSMCRSFLGSRREKLQHPGMDAMELGGSDCLEEGSFMNCFSLKAWEDLL
jgi:hypothetical protein